VTGVQLVAKRASEIYALTNAKDNLTLLTPDSQHDFPDATRQQAYEWLDRQLK
jgi:hypothetical protein